MYNMNNEFVDIMRLFFFYYVFIMLFIYLLDCNHAHNFVTWLDILYYIFI